MPSLIDKSGNIAYYGRVSWGNFVDWLITLCLGGIIALSTMLLGGVRPETHVLLLPLFALLMVLHGLWLAVEKESPKRMSHVPLLFVPFVIWVGVNVFFFSPTVWRGWYELIYAVEAFVFFWVSVNNVRTRSHLWVMVLLALAPAGYAGFFGFYQFFQNSPKIVTALTEYGLMLSPDFLGQATGSFADPSSFAVFLLVLLPVFLIAGLVPRLSKIIRFFCIYIALMLITLIFLTQAIWAIGLLLLILVVLPWGCFLKVSRRFWGSIVGVLLVLCVVLPQAFFLPQFQARYQAALSDSGEAVRLVLWEEALNISKEAPLLGAGAGSFSSEFEQSASVSLPDLPMTPHNDYLLIVSEYGLIGGVLFLLPSLFVVWRAFGKWRAEPARVRMKHVKASIMPPNKFFLSVGLAGTLSFAACLFCTFVFSAPALTLYGMLFFAILVKLSFVRRLTIPCPTLIRIIYFGVGIVCAYGFYVAAAPRVQAQALELYARQRLDQIVAKRVHVSGDSELLNEVIEQYEAAILLDPENADLWIGLSAANCQRFFRNPSKYEQIGMVSVDSAQRAIGLSEGYWMGWAQLGIAESLSGNASGGEQALRHALELAPNNSNAHYYWASYLSHFKERQAEAILSVERALEINPNHAAARRLQQKLLIL